MKKETKKVIKGISTFFLTATILAIIMNLPGIAEPYVDIPATRLPLRVSKVTVYCDDNGVPIRGLIEWTYTTPLGNVSGYAKVNRKQVLTLWNMSREGYSLDDITDQVIKTITKKKGVPIQGSVSNIVPYLVTEINVQTNTIYSDYSSNQVERIEVVATTNQVFRIISK